MTLEEAIARIEQLEHSLDRLSLIGSTVRVQLPEGDTSVQKDFQCYNGYRAAVEQVDLKRDRARVVFDNGPYPSAFWFPIKFLTRLPS